MRREGKKVALTTQPILLLRVIVGLYLMYLTGSLLKDGILTRYAGAAEAGIIVILVLFAVVGTALVVISMLMWAKGYYVDGKMDVSTEESAQEDSEKEQ